MHLIKFIDAAGKVVRTVGTVAELPDAKRFAKKQAANHPGCDAVIYDELGREQFRIAAKVAA